MKRVIFVQIGTGFFAVETDQVKHFVRNVQVSDFGNKSENPNICGLISLGDEVIPVLDIDRWFGEKQMIFSERTMFVIMMSGSKPFAFPISDVIKSNEVPSECFHVLPAVVGKVTAHGRGNVWLRPSNSALGLHSGF